MTTTHIIQPDASALAAHVAEWLTTLAEASTGLFSISLSGGSTPKLLYSLLAAEPFASRMPWERVHLFFGDERFVAHTHPDSNYRMVKEALLDHVAIPDANVHAIQTDTTPHDAAARYAATLQAFYGEAQLRDSKPLFNVTLLGLGEDGHTASLFPNTDALDERTAWTAAVIGAKPEARLTLTYPALESSQTVAFLIAGASKHNMLKRTMAQDVTIPAGCIKPVKDLVFFTDEAAANG